MDHEVDYFQVHWRPFELQPRGQHEVASSPRGGKIRRLRTGCETTRTPQTLLDQKYDSHIVIISPHCILRDRSSGPFVLCCLALYTASASIYLQGGWVTPPRQIGERGGWGERVGMGTANAPEGSTHDLLVRAFASEHCGGLVFQLETFLSGASGAHTTCNGRWLSSLTDDHGSSFACNQRVAEDATRDRLA